MMVCPCAIHRDGVESLWWSMVVGPLGVEDAAWVGYVRGLEGFML